MLVVTYKKLNENGLTHLPIENNSIKDAKEKADYLYKKGYFNVKVARLKQDIIYEPGVR